MNRAELRFLIESSFTAGRPDYARVLSTAWLAVSPGDLAVRFYFARALAAEKQVQDALKELAAIISVDYEHTAAYKLLATLAPRTLDAAWASASAHVISGSTLLADIDAPAWMASARQSVLAIEAGNFDDAREQIDIALRTESAHPLLSLILLKTHWRAQEIDLALPLARGFSDRWPQGVAFRLCMAEGLLRNGSAHQAVEVLHSASTLDAGADVVNRYWSEVHPYRNLWPQSPDIPLPAPLPAEVASLLGLNRLSAGAATATTTSETDVEEAPAIPKAAKPESNPPRNKANRPTRSGISGIFGNRNKKGSAAAAKSRLNSDFHATLNSQTVSASGEPNPIAYDPTPLPEKAQAKTASPKPVAEELQDIQNTLSSIASQIGSTRYQRKPSHVIVFSPKLLEAKFGPESAEGVLKLIGELGKVTAKLRHITVLLLAPEAPSAEFNLKPVNPSNAWDVKMMLQDLDRQLMGKGQAIGSLLIIGGDDLLPFHRLPNPTDDVDDDIPSDNPYGTSDDNYFIPEWPVGRIPSPCGRDPEPLSKMLRNTIAAHQSTGSSKWLGGFGGIFGWLITRIRKPSLPASMGYSASVWKDASAEVFSPIGNSKQLHFSPPVDSNNAPSMARMRLSYFNLHGIEDGPNWFGQRDEGDGYGPLYPVAFEPKDTGKEPLPKVVFTEACYGANIIEKTEPDAALSLRFLTDGVCAFVGSTKIAYGSVAAPLIGADMLGRSFWEQLLTGVPVGEAFRRAKLQVAHTMNKRQSFLDGEDQKTLISFVLYGDPSLPIISSAAKTGPAKRSKDLPMVKTVAMEYETTEEDDIQPETVTEIKSLLSRYLPGSESAEISVSRPLSPIGAKSTTAPTHRVYTVAKTIRYDSHTLPTFAKVTVNKAGKVVKLAVSR
jgi:hypothetical protein